MFKMTEAIYQTLKQEEGLKVFTEDREKNSEVWLQFGIKNGGSYRIRFINTDDDNDVAVRVFSLISVDETRRAAVMPVLNEINRKYRYVKFVMDNDGDVNVEYDYLVRCPDPTASARELIIRITRIIDEVYPLLMRTMWA